MSTQQQLSLSGVEPKAHRPYRGSTIYESRGRAREYRELACNLYRGCDHACTYCYAVDLTRMNRPQFAHSVPRAGVIAKLERDARGYGLAGETRQVLFCFTCDPYQRADVKHGLTRQAIEVCHRYGLNVCILTKGGRRALRDIDLLTPADSFATTLTTLDDQESLKWEPNAALPEERLSVLRAFHDRGVPTWASLEPVINPDMALEIIRRTHTFVDEFKVGTLNHHPYAQQIDWPRFAHEVKDLLDSLGCRYYLKHDLRHHLGHRRE